MSVAGNAEVDGDYLHLVFDDDTDLSQDAFHYDEGEQTQVSDSLANALGYESMTVEPGDDVTITYNGTDCQGGCVDLLIVDSSPLDGESEE